jgi:hypothetical protein
MAMKNARSESGQSSPLSAFPLTARSNQSEQRIRPTFRGSILDADPPTQGVKIARRMTTQRLGGVSGTVSPSAFAVLRLTTA